MRKRKGLTFGGMVMTAIYMFLIAVAQTGCGQVTNNDPPGGGDGPSLTLTYDGPRGDSTTTADDGSPIVRANSRDTIEIVATVSDLSSYVGFFIAAGWGTWTGGTLEDDGFTYYTADKTGKAKAVLTAGANAGKQEVIARSLEVEARLMITFETGTFALFPSTVVLDNDQNQKVWVEAVGGLAPISWWVSHPDVLNLYIRPDTLSASIEWLDSRKPISTGSLPSGGGTLYAMDSEGQTATATIYAMSTGCTTGTLTLNPTSGVITNVGAFIGIDVTVVDLDRAVEETPSITVDISLPAHTLPNGNSVALFPSSLGSDIYYGRYEFKCDTCLGVGKTSVANFTYTDPDNASANCDSKGVTTAFTVNGGCTAGLLSINPTTGSVDLANESVLVTVAALDPDLATAGIASIAATITPSAGATPTPNAVTLTPAATGSSSYVGTISLTCGVGGCGAAGATYTFSVDTSTTDCADTAATAIFTDN